MIKQLNKDGTLDMTQTEFNKVHNDYKSNTKGQESVIQLDSNNRTVLVYVNIIGA